MPDLNLGDLTVELPALDADGTIPDRFASGSDISPAVRWTGVPEGAVELVLIVHDPDAPLIDGFTHWVVTGIDPNTDGLDEREPGADLDRGTAGLNEMGDAAYMGPAPPPGHGPHHYFFHLYALDQAVAAEGEITRSDLLDRMDGHIIAQARVVGTYEIPSA